MEQGCCEIKHPALEYSIITAKALTQSLWSVIKRINHPGTAILAKKKSDLLCHNMAFQEN